MTSPLPIDVLIFGGGAAGLWLLDDLLRAGCGTLLLEANDLGSGQTIASMFAAKAFGRTGTRRGGLRKKAALAIRATGNN
jgi:hypothetical protein